jgi:hypothetical protein
MSIGFCLFVPGAARCLAFKGLVAHTRPAVAERLDRRDVDRALHAKFPRKIEHIVRAEHVDGVHAPPAFRIEPILVLSGIVNNDVRARHR